MTGPTWYYGSYFWDMLEGLAFVSAIVAIAWIRIWLRERKYNNPDPMEDHRTNPDHWHNDWR